MSKPSTEPQKLREQFLSLLEKNEDLSNEDLKLILEMPEAVGSTQEWEKLLLKIRLDTISPQLHTPYVNLFKKIIPRDDLFEYASKISELAIRSINSWEKSELTSTMLGLVAQISISLKGQVTELLQRLWNGKENDTEIERFTIRAEFVSELALAHGLADFGEQVCKESIAKIVPDSFETAADTKLRLYLRLFQFKTLSGDFADALDYLEQVELQEEEQDPELVSLFHTLRSQSLFQVQKWEEAREATETAIGFEEKRGKPSVELLAAHYANLSLIYEKLGKLKEAIKYRKLLVENQELHSDHKAVFTDRFALASLLEADKQIKKARRQYESLFEEMNTEEDPKLNELKGAVCSRLARHYAIDNDYSKAKQLMTQSYEFYEQTDDTYAKMTVALALSEIYEFLGELEEGKKFKDIAMKLANELRA